MTGRRFRYCKDPVFLAVFGLYWLNRWVIKPIALGHVGFFHDYFNDLICIPFWLPPMLLLHRKIGIRRHDGPPTAFEVIVHLVIWSIFFEGIGPRLHGLFPHATADPWDAAAYTAGAAIAAAIWSAAAGRRFGLRIPLQSGVLRQAQDTTQSKAVSFGKLRMPRNPKRRRAAAVQSEGAS